ncbi:MAG: CidA/LrgA family protein [Rhizobacter sp.]
MLKGLSVIILLQLFGELIVSELNLPIPGAILGLIFFLIALFALGRVPKDCESTSDALLGNLSILFIPAGVGIMAIWSDFSSGGIAIIFVIIISNFFAIGATAITMDYMSRRRRRKRVD